MRNFVFDIYGTLIDIHTAEWREEFQRFFNGYFNRTFGIKVNFSERYGELCAQFASEEEPDFIRVSRQIAEEGGANPTARQLIGAARVFRKKSTLGIEVYAGVKALLKQLKARGHQLYILSNAQSAFTLRELKKLGLYKFFDGIELSSDFGFKKPSSEFFNHILEKYGLNPADSVYVGNDINCDIIPSKAAGMAAAYIRSDISPSEDGVEKAALIADFATDSFSALSGYLLSL